MADFIELVCFLALGTTFIAVLLFIAVAGSFIIEALMEDDDGK